MNKTKLTEKIVKLASERFELMRIRDKECEMESKDIYAEMIGEKSEELDKAIKTLISYDKKKGKKRV